MCQHVSNDLFWINLPCFNHQLIASHAGHVSRCEAWTSNMPSSSSFVLASFELFSYVTNNFLLSLWEKNYASSTPPDFLHYFQSKQVHTFYLYSPMCRVKWPVYVIGFTLKLKLICWFFPSMFGLLNSVSSTKVFGTSNIPWPLCVIMFLLNSLQKSVSIRMVASKKKG